MHPLMRFSIMRTDIDPTPAKSYEKLQEEIKMKKPLLVSALCAAVLMTGCTENGAVSDNTEAFGTNALAETTETREAAETVKIGKGIIDLKKSSDEDKQSYGDGYFLNQSLFIEKGSYRKDGKSVIALYLYNTSDWSLEKIIDTPDGWIDFGERIDSDEADVFLKYELYRFDDNRDYVYGLMTIYDDLTYDITDNYVRDGTVLCCGHKLILEENSISLADGENPVEIVSLSDETPFDVSEVDGNRFVYQSMSQSNPLFSAHSTLMGIYDFKEGKHTSLPKLENNAIIGIFNGKMYTYTRSAANISMLYVTDLETLKTSLLSDTSFEELHDDGIEYAMTTDGMYILCAAGKNKDTDFPAKAYVLDAGTGEVVSEVEIPEEISYSRGILYNFYCVNERTAAIMCSSQDKIFIFDIEI